MISSMRMRYERTSKRQRASTAHELCTLSIRTNQHSKEMGKLGWTRNESADCRARLRDCERLMLLGPAYFAVAFALLNRVPYNPPQLEDK